MHVGSSSSRGFWKAATSGNFGFELEFKFEIQKTVFETHDSIRSNVATYQFGTPMVQQRCEDQADRIFGLKNFEFRILNLNVPARKTQLADMAGKSVLSCTLREATLLTFMAYANLDAPHTYPDLPCRSTVSYGNTLGLSRLKTAQHSTLSRKPRLHLSTVPPDRTLSQINPLLQSWA